MLIRRPLILAALVACLYAAPAEAQQSLEDTLSFLLTNQSIPTGDFVKDEEAAQTTSDTISRLLLVELTTLPLSSSSAGFTYRLNPSLGTMERASDSFGPFFAERSLTAGRGRVSLGATYQFARYVSLDGNDLRDGSFVTTANQFRDEAAPFDVERLTLELESQTVTFFSNVGLTNRIDISVAVPVVSLSLDGSRLNVYRGDELLQATASGEASGIGDVALRAKATLTGVGASGVAVLGEVRLPTGSREDLLGAGEASYRVLLVGSFANGPFAAHVNAGGSTGGLSDEFVYRGAVGFAATPRVTLIGEWNGRWLADIGSVIQTRAAHPTIDGVDTLRLETSGSGTHVAAAVAGVKWNVGGAWLLNASVSFPTTATGLRPDPVLLAGLEFAIGN
jgi:hypothetical protein